VALAWLNFAETSNPQEYPLTRLPQNLHTLPSKTRSLRKPDSRKGICALPLPWPLISEPEILVVDEALAVGDAEFQKKCLGKIDEVSRLEGRTVLLVSHNMAAIAEMADRALLLDAGSVAVDGRSTAAPVLNSR
jgi:ABC-type branched-subunit amino acid transport system ATPase component